MTYEELNSAVIAWGEIRNIVSPQYKQVYAQLNKVQEELLEVEHAIRALAATEDHGGSMAAASLKCRLQAELLLELGDLMVTVIIMSACLCVDPVDALQAAYDKIKHRTGTTINGQFVKDTLQ
jgi:NTP pyrophosphatase (non-canonical NTP hydrolase)